jgi:hypothetical protein
MSRWKSRLTGPHLRRSVQDSPKGPSDAGGGDDINAHASSRFLRATDSASEGLRRLRGYDRPVTSLVLFVAGFVALALGWLLVRRLGARARVGRILASTPIVPVDEAVRLADGRPRYVAVGGRLDSDHEFYDEHDRPLVLRRSRLEVRTGSRWRIVADHREIAPFRLAGGLASIEVDGQALDEGLIVVRRESEGTAGEIPDRVPPGTPADAPARLRVELLSTVEHALALGVPTMGPAGMPILRPGLGRPLILTTLEPAEAMRLLAADHRSSTRAGAVLMAGGLIAAAAGLALAIAGAVA